jgi:HSF-type DNA-binding
MSRRCPNAAPSDTDTVVPKTKGDQECHFIYGHCNRTNGNTRPKQQSQRLRPGKTAKKFLRHFVVHTYHDHSQEEDPCCCNSTLVPHQGCCMSSNATTLFPLKLHTLLRDIENDQMDQIVSWAPHGRCFFIHKPQKFVNQVLPRYVIMAAEQPARPTLPIYRHIFLL